MLRNYITIAFRNLLKRKLFSFINIFGLAIGMAVSLVLWKYMEFEMNFDAHNKNAGVLYRVTSSIYSSGEQWAFGGYDFGPALQNEIPEIKTVIRRHPLYGGAVVSYTPANRQPVRFREDNLQFVDSAFVQSFTFQPLFGDLHNALVKPSSVVLTRSMSEKYFGKGIDPTGETLQISGYYSGPYQVTAVIENPPENSHIVFGFLLSMHNLLASDEYRNTNERLDNFMTYVELFPQADPASAEAKMPAFLKSYLGKENTLKHAPAIKLQPILDIHFADNSSPPGQREGGSMRMVYFLGLISLFILSIAWVNYINLSTARAMERAREVGVKKTIGAMRGQLITQFILESVIVNLLGVIVAIALATPLLEAIGTILDKTFYVDFTQSTIWIWLFLLFIVGTMVSGFYPAFILSSFKAKDVIKGKLMNTGRGLTLRKALVVFQFTASLLLLIGTFAVNRQLRFMQDQNKNEVTDQILIVKGPQVVDPKNLQERLISFKNELAKISSVLNVATSDAVPGGGYNWGIHAARKGASRDETIAGQNIEVIFVDPDFMNTYGMKLKSGRMWNAESATDLRSIVVNEASINTFGLIDDQKALNENIVFNDVYDMHILGVSENQHWYSLKNQYAALAFWPQKICGAYYSIRIRGNVKETTDAIGKLYHNAFPDDPFDHYFHNEFFNKQYKSDQQFSAIFNLFAVLAVLIACLGLLGLASFTTLQRMKEISIRKILGASVGSIMSLLSGQFMKLTLVAAVIAFPVALYGVNAWLSGFAFRIAFTWDLYVIPLLILLLIALVTVISQIVRGASVNPAQNLRSE